MCVTAFHFAALFYNWYENLGWVDIPLHIMGGIFIGMLFTYLFLVRHSGLRADRLLPLFVAGLGFVALIGVFWEFYELFTDVFILHKYQILLAPRYLHF